MALDYALTWASFRRLHSFAAIDFETANAKRASACAVGIVRVDNDKITGRLYHRIKPPRAFAEVTLQWVHGLTPEDLEDAPTWRTLWPTVRHFLKGIEAFAAHNASFDRSVLLAACGNYGITAPDHLWLDTVMLARQRWHIHPTKLNRVCAELGIPLDHHNAASDAEAVAQIILAAKGQR